MTMMRFGLCALAAGALPLLIASGEANAATHFWSPPSVEPTLNDGLELTGATLKGQSMLYKASLPFFLKDDQRFEFLDTYRVAGPFVGEADGFSQVWAIYQVPVDDGVVEAKLSYTLIDQADYDSDEAQLSSWVEFQGPEGDYHFFWRLDTEVGSRMDNRLELLDGDSTFAVTHESAFDLWEDTARIVDTRSYEEQTQLYFMANSRDNARLYVTNFHRNQADALPDGLVNDEALSGKTGGNDMVLWYETSLTGVSRGLTGPDMYAKAAYRVNAIVEQDKMSSAPFINSSASVYGETRSMASGFATAGINIVDVKNDKSNIADDASTTNAELHSIMVSNKTYEYQDSSTQWYSWVGQTLKSSSGLGVLGIMFDDGSTNTDGKPRQGCGIFYEAHDTTWPDGDSIQAELLLSMTHETGHCYNQHHEDFCPGRIRGSTFHKGSSIMGYAFQDTNIWTFSTGSIATMSSEDAQWSRPGHGVDFTTNGSYNMTDAHSAKHASTSCRRFCCYFQ